MILILLLTLIVGLITYYRILVQIDMGPVSDSVVFMANALFFAGQGTGYSNLLFPPLFPLLVSLVYRMGFVSTNTIFIVDGLLFIFGVVGIFLLLKLRFRDLESFLGAILYATFPIVLIILGLGISDLSSVSLTIWTFYFLILAIKKDYRFFYLALPFAMLSFLDRYNNILLVFPILLYIIINKDIIKFKHVIGGIGTSLIILLPVLVFFNGVFGNYLYPFINFGTASTISTSIENTYYNPNVLYFLQKLPVLIGDQGVLILLIIILGCTGYLVYQLTKMKKIDLDFIRGMDRNSKLKLVTLIALGLIFIASFGKTSYFVNEFIFFVFAYIFYDLVKTREWKYLDVDILIFSWFMAFFIFHSIFVIKDNRYFVIMAAPFAYMMILGLRYVTGKISLKIKGRNVLFPGLAILLLAVMLFSTASQIPNILQSNGDNVDFNNKIIETSIWLKNYDPDYRNKNIYSDLWPNFSWFLKTDVKPVPIFKDNKIIYKGSNFTFNQEDSNAFNNYLVSNNAYYYISVRQGLNLTSYTPIKEFGYMIIYKKNY